MIRAFCARPFPALLFIVLLNPLALAGAASAQGISITPMGGAFFDAGSLRAIRGEADQARIDRSGTFALGLNLEMGGLRGSVAYATGSTISEEGVEGDIGDGTLLAAAVDLVIRPIPRVLLQPYLVAGGGLVREEFSFRDERFDGFPRDETSLAAHVGLGADLMFGKLGIAAEVADWISRPSSSMQHSVFLLVGVRLGL